MKFDSFLALIIFINSMAFTAHMIIHHTPSEVTP